MLTKEELCQLSQQIAEAEQGTLGEIRITLQTRRHFFQRKKPIFNLAEREFHRLRMNKTEHRTGVLIYILENDREFQILGDVGIAAKVSQGEWDEMAQSLVQFFQKNQYVEGLIQLVQRVGKRLKTDFPNTNENRNELPNEVVLR